MNGESTLNRFYTALYTLTSALDLYPGAMAHQMRQEVMKHQSL